MTRKRLMKLLMGLGYQRDGSIALTDAGGNRKATLDAAMDESAKSVPEMFSGKGKALKTLYAWRNGEISDGEAVKIIGHLKMNRRNVLVVDKTRNKMFIV